MPPMPSRGRIAIASTMMPMPPYHCSAWRHRLTAGGRYSMPVITVEPVVVSADSVSKNTSVTDMCGSEMKNGIAAAAAMKTQASVTSR
jgi:hypothetical protein